QHGVANTREFPSVVRHRPTLRSATMTVDADPSNSDLVLVERLLMGHNSHLQRIGVKRIVKMQRVNDVCDFQHKVQAFSSVLAIRFSSPAQTEKSNTPRQKLGMIAWLCALRQVDIDMEHDPVLYSTDIFQVEVNTVRHSGFRSSGKTRGHLAADAGIELDRRAGPRAFNRK